MIGKELYDHNICLTEDKILMLALFKVGNSFKFIEDYGIIYIQNDLSICHTWSVSYSKRIIHDFFMLSIIFYNLTKNTSEIQIVVEELKKHFNEFSTMLDYSHKILFLKLYKNILKRGNFPESDKKVLKYLMNKNKKNF